MKLIKKLQNELFLLIILKNMHVFKNKYYKNEIAVDDVFEIMTI